MKNPYSSTLNVQASSISVLSFSSVHLSKMAPSSSGCGTGICQLNSNFFVIVQLPKCSIKCKWGARKNEHKFLLNGRITANELNQIVIVNLRHQKIIINLLWKRKKREGFIFSLLRTFEDEIEEEGERMMMIMCKWKEVFFCWLKSPVKGQKKGGRYHFKHLLKYNVEKEKN